MSTHLPYTEGVAREPTEPPVWMISLSFDPSTIFSYIAGVGQPVNSNLNQAQIGKSFALAYLCSYGVSLPLPLFS
jgi:hypothetical protein